MTRALPFFSVIVPTFARDAQLKACLGGLAALDYPPDRFEVIVVDDGSGQPPVLTAYRHRLNIRLVLQEHAGPAAARNVGALWARGDYLAFVDDDCVPAEGWLRALAAKFERMPEAALGGAVINALHTNPYAAASHLMIRYLYGAYAAGKGTTPFFASMNLAFPARAFQELEGFNIRYAAPAAEDRDICDRWVNSGRRLAYADEAVVFHSHRLSFRSFCRQHFHYGRGASAFHWARAARFPRRSRLERPRFYLNLVRYPLSVERWPRAWGLAALLVLSQLVHAAGFFHQSILLLKVSSITSEARRRPK